MLGYYELDNEMIKKLPKTSKNIKENIYEICCPLVIKNKKSLPEEIRCLYEMLEVPIISFDKLDTFDKRKYIKLNNYIRKFSMYLRINNNIEILEEGNIGHVLRVGNNVKKLCEQLQMSRKQIKKIYIAALFHDIGKYKIPKEIVSKKQRLSREEYEIMKKHSNYSYEMLKDFLPKDILEMIKSHHERCDKSGYPEGIIPNVGAKIIGIVDSFDAMVSNRVYVKRKTVKEALNELLLCGISKDHGGKGYLYDRKIVTKFIKLQQEKIYN